MIQINVLGGWKKSICPMGNKIELLVHRGLGVPLINVNYSPLQLTLLQLHRTTVATTISISTVPPPL